MYLLERTQIVPRPRAEVFPLFSDPSNLEALTPSSVGFTIVTPRPIEMKVGAVIDYKIKISGIPLTWRTRIEAYDPPHMFIDVQLKGPYKTWRHTHTFRDVPGGTELGDHLEYDLPFGPLGTVAHALFVKRQLKAIFDYRTKVLTEMFGRMPN